MTVTSLTASQFAQWMDLLPDSVQVSGVSTVKSESHAWPAAGMTVSSFTASQLAQWIDLLPASVQVAALSTVKSASQLWPGRGQRPSCRRVRGRLRIAA